MYTKVRLLKKKAGDIWHDFTLFLCILAMIVKRFCTFSYLNFAISIQKVVEPQPSKLFTNWNAVGASEVMFTMTVSSYIYRPIFREFKWRQAASSLLQWLFNLPFTGRQIMRRPYLTLQLIYYDNFFLSVGLQLSVTLTRTSLIRQNSFNLLLNTSLLIHLPLTGVFLMVNVATNVSQPFYVKLSKQNLNQRKRSWRVSRLLWQKTCTVGKVHFKSIKSLVFI